MQVHGYRVVRLSFIHPEKPVHYNLLKYVKTTQQIQQLASALVRSSRAYSADPFWDDSSLMLINSLISYIKETVPVNSKDHNFHSILDMLRAAGRNSSSSKHSPWSFMMDELHENKPKSWTYKQFQNVNQAPEKHSIL